MQTTTTRSTRSPEGTTMRAVTQHTYGSAAVLDVTTVDRPTIGDDEVLIEVVAAGLDRGVWHLMTGMPYLIRIMGFGLTKPKNPVPGMDVAGRVVEVGRDVTRFAVGDEVFGIGTGTFAEFAAAKESKLVHKPDTITFDQAAVSTISGITALQALTTVGRLEPGQHVLVDRCIRRGRLVHRAAGQGTRGHRHRRRQHRQARRRPRPRRRSRHRLHRGADRRRRAGGTTSSSTPADATGSPVSGGRSRRPAPS